MRRLELRKIIKEELKKILKESSYKTFFEGTTIEIKNVDQQFGRLNASEIANFVKKKLEIGDLKVNKIFIECI